MSRPGFPLPKYRQVYGALEQAIRDGVWKPGERLPSEAELVRRFATSRITVGRAVRDLQLAGMVDRQAGSGTYVTSAAIGAAGRPRPGEAGGRAGAALPLSFGLLIPDLGVTEIFEPICQGMMASPLAREHALLWGSAVDAAEEREEQALELCRRYIARKVAGVFFAPLELTPAKDEVNRRIARALDDAGVPVVLLDRTVTPYPQRGHHDLVGIDNRRAGHVVTAHLVGLGARRVAFVGMGNAAATVDAREAGWRDALLQHGLPLAFGGAVAANQSLARRLDPADLAAVRALLDDARPDAVVCANDRTAARLMHTLISLGVRIPDDVRLAGIDDVDYAALLPVPLTTLRQPTRAIGAAAMAAMLERVEHADLPTRDILLQGTLVVRRSCGSPLAAQAA